MDNKFFYKRLYNMYKLGYYEPSGMFKYVLEYCEELELIINKNYEFYSKQNELMMIYQKDIGYLWIDVQLLHIIEFNNGMIVLMMCVFNIAISNTSYIKNISLQLQYL